jgi:hypothetical protein
MKQSGNSFFKEGLDKLKEAALQFMLSQQFAKG